MELLLATKNKNKKKHYGELLKNQGIKLLSLEDINVKIEVDESGNNPIQNAILKATAYFKETNIPTLALDEGLFFEGLQKELQPGTHVRRINGKRLSDNEMIDYYVGLVNQYGNHGLLPGYFLYGCAICDGNIHSHQYQSKRLFSNKQSKVIDEGYPLDSIQIIESLGKFKSELTKEEEAIILNREQQELLQFVSNIMSQEKKHDNR